MLRLRLLAAATVAAATLVPSAPALAADQVSFTKYPVNFGVPTSPSVSADFNGDGITDVVHVLSVGPKRVRVRYGAASTSASEGLNVGPVYTPATLSAGRFDPAYLAAGDFNGDGFTDLAIAGSLIDPSTSAAWAFAWGTATGLSATLSTPYSLPASSFQGITGVDFDNDGRDELAATMLEPYVVTSTISFPANTVSVFHYGDDGSYQHTVQFPFSAATGSRPITSGDFDSDGNADIAFIAEGYLIVAFGSGLGATPIAGAGRTFAAGHYGLQPGAPTSLATGDLDGDGRPEIVLASGGKVRVWRAPVARTTSNVQTLMSYDAPGARGVAVADFDHDGKLDVLTSNTDPSLAFLRGNGDGSLDAATAVPGGSLGSPQESFSLGDFNGDGTTDVFSTGGTVTSLNLAAPSTAPHRSALISEVRFSGPKGAGDQYVQLYNPGATPLVMSGWKLRLSSGRSVSIPHGTVVPAAGHVLLATPRKAPTGYGLASAAGTTLGLPFGATPSSAGTVWGGLALPSQASGIALVDPFGTTQDAVGSTSADGSTPAPTGYFAGTALTPFTAVGESAWVRKFSAGVPVNTGNNAADFVAVDTSASGNDGSVLGSPRPDHLAAPTMKNDFLQSSLVAPAKPASASPNRVVVPAGPGTDATLTINRTITNCSGTAKSLAVCANAATIDAVTVTKLRFRITALSTVGNSRGAQLRVVKSTDATVDGVDVKGLPLDYPSAASGGGLNSSLTATALIPSGLAPGASVNVAFKFIVSNPGAYTFGFNTEDDLIEGEAAPAPGQVHEAPVWPAGGEAIVTAVAPADGTPAPAAPTPAAPAVETPTIPGPVAVDKTPAASAGLAVDAATETTHGVIPASAFAAAPVSGSVAAPATAKPAASTTKAAPSKSKKATCKVVKTTKSKGKAKSKKSAKPCTTKKTTKAKTPTKSAKKVAARQ